MGISTHMDLKWLTYGTWMSGVVGLYVIKCKELPKVTQGLERCPFTEIQKLSIVTFLTFHSVSSLWIVLVLGVLNG